MEAFDTNVIMRLLVRDDAEQFGRAEQAFRQAVAGGGLLYLFPATTVALAPFPGPTGQTGFTGRSTTHSARATWQRASDPSMMSLKSRVC